MNTQQILQSVITHSQKITQEYGEARADYENLKEQQKTMLAQFTGIQEGSSESERSRRALSSPDYKDYLEGLAQANTRYRKAEAHYNSLQLQLKAAQSLNSRDRTEVGISNFTP